MNGPNGGLRLLGTALVCGALLVFQILSTRLLSVVLEDNLIISAISIAMLGMGVATSLMSLRAAPAGSERGRWLGWGGAALGVSYLVVFLLLRHLSDAFNAALETAIDEGGLVLYVAAVRATLFGKMAMVGAIVFIPYFLFGFFIAELFGSARPGDYHRLYAADLAGAAAGCVLSIVALDNFGYAGCAALILAATFAGAMAFSWGRGPAPAVANGAAALAAIAALAVPGAYERLEPHPLLGALSRNFERNYTAEVDWHTWNAHSRIAHVALTNRKSGASLQVYAHQNGDGWARVPDFDSADLAATSPLTPLTTMFAPKRVLVLFAGLGADMISIDTACGGACDITGVEINRHMVEHALATGDPRLAAFLARPNIHLKIAEAREFLERDRTKYDAILLSWWGAGASHFIGSSGMLAQYLYTKEAFAALMDHLTPAGTIVLYNGSKAQTLVTLNALYRERGLGSLDRDVVIMTAKKPYPAAARLVRVLDVLEEMRLVLKPSGFSADDMAAVRRTAAAMDSKLILYPDGVAPGRELYRDIAGGADLAFVNQRLIAEQDAELSVVTDDRPFIDQLVPRAQYFDVAGWFGGESVNPMWLFTRGFIQFTLLMCGAAVVLILGPLCLRAGPARSRANLVHLAYFAALGAGFMGVEIGLVRKLGLLLGHPSYAISVVLAALILSTGLGALASRALFAAGRLTEKRAAAAAAAYIVAFTVLYPSVAPLIIVLPFAAKALVVAAILFPPGFLMGQLFPQGLARAGAEDPRLVPWAWAVNGTMSTVGSALAFLMSFPFGFDAILYAGAAIYCTILVLPLGRPAPEPVLGGEPVLG